MDKAVNKPREKTVKDCRHINGLIPCGGVLGDIVDNIRGRFVILSLTRTQSGSENIRRPGSDMKGNKRRKYSFKVTPRLKHEEAKKTFPWLTVTQKCV